MSRTINAYAIYKRHNAIMSALENPVTIREITEITKLTRETVERFLKHAIKSGDVEIVRYIMVVNAKTRVLRLKQW